MLIGAENLLGPHSPKQVIMHAATKNMTNMTDKQMKKLVLYIWSKQFSTENKNYCKTWPEGGS